jgi:phage terminase small subunit
MTDKQKLFCDEYLIDMNATRAYRIAYPSIKKESTINSLASRLLRNDKVNEYLEKRKLDRQKRTEITQDMVIKELAKIAFVDMRKLYNERGNLLDIHSIDDDTAGAISSIETLEEYSGYGENREKTGDTQKVKMLDKTKALELLGKHLGMFKETNINVNMNYEDYISKVVDDDEY